MVSHAIYDRVVTFFSSELRDEADQLAGPKSGYESHQKLRVAGHTHKQSVTGKKKLYFVVIVIEKPKKTEHSFPKSIVRLLT